MNKEDIAHLRFKTLELAATILTQKQDTVSIEEVVAEATKLTKFIHSNL